jgi:hypothetical protein
LLQLIGAKDPDQEEAGVLLVTLKWRPALSAPLGQPDLPRSCKIICPQNKEPVGFHARSHSIAALRFWEIVFKDLDGSRMR